MSLDELHPLDADKVRHLAEALCDISAGRRLTRQGLEPLLVEILIRTTSRCSLDGADTMLDRLLAVVDDRLGRDEAIAQILAEIAEAETQTPRFVVGWFDPDKDARL